MSRSIKPHPDGREEYEGDDQMRVERYDQAEEIERLEAERFHDAGIIDALKAELSDLRAKVRRWADIIDDGWGHHDVAVEMREEAEKC